jgi:excisionase family DNA binding protein
MTVAQFRRWLQQKVDYLQAFPDGCRWQEDAIDIQGFIDEAYQHAVDLHLPGAAAACRRGPVTIRLLECLNAIPEPDGEILSPPQIAKMLGVKSDTVRGWIEDGKLTAANVAKSGKKKQWKVKRDDLDAFLERRQPETQPPKKPKAKTLVQRY